MRKLELLNGDITLFVEELDDNIIADEIRIFDDKHFTVGVWGIETLAEQAQEFCTSLKHQYEVCIIRPLLNAKGIDDVLWQLAYDYFVASKDKNAIVDWITASDAFGNDDVEMISRMSYKELQEYCQTIGYALAKVGKYYVLGEF